ncbi:hypothetical protein ACTXGK_10825 [Psychrobacter sp. T6-5]|uniref:hypothetical protein n=1 Tax=Psychrobacter sp. T6-5 TaxID=3457451 RepID=UPI003FD26E7D
MATVDFYKIYIPKEKEAQLPSSFVSIEQCFKQLIANTKTFIDDYERDFYNFKALKNNHIGGIFRKVRTGEPITVGKTGTKGRDIKLNADEGKFETNHLVYFADKDIIAYIRNQHGNHYKRLEKCLRDAFGSPVCLTQILSKGSIDSILEYRSVVKIDVAFPVKSTVINSHNSNDWGAATLDSLLGSGADTISFQANINLNKKQHGTIKNAKSVLKNALSSGAVKAKILVEDLDGEREPIDLIADKIKYQDDGYNYAKENLPDKDVYDFLVKAYLGKLDEINEVF